MTIQTPEIIEFLEEGPYEAVEVVEEDQDILELYVEETISTVETSVPEELELIDLGPSPLGNVTVDPAYAGLRIHYGPGPLPDPSTMPNTVYIVLPS
ncbi:MAG: hypothetical protein [Phage AS32]|nr:MAG: hypothetical protein [Phage AS32]